MIEFGKNRLASLVSSIYFASISSMQVSTATGKSFEGYRHATAFLPEFLFLTLLVLADYLRRIFLPFRFATFIGPGLRRTSNPTLHHQH